MVKFLLLLRRICRPSCGGSTDVRLLLQPHEPLRPVIWDSYRNLKWLDKDIFGRNWFTMGFQTFYISPDSFMDVGKGFFDCVSLAVASFEYGAKYMIAGPLFLFDNYCVIPAFHCRASLLIDSAFTKNHRLIRPFSQDFYSGCGCGRNGMPFGIVQELVSAIQEKIGWAKSYARSTRLSLFPFCLCISSPLAPTTRQGGCGSVRLRFPVSLRRS
jgi:hypothetical protein